MSSTATTVSKPKKSNATVGTPVVDSTNAAATPTEPKKSKKRSADEAAAESVPAAAPVVEGAKEKKEKKSKGSAAAEPPAAAPVAAPAAPAAPAAAPVVEGTKEKKEKKSKGAAAATVEPSAAAPAVPVAAAPVAEASKPKKEKKSSGSDATPAVVASSDAAAEGAKPKAKRSKKSSDGSTPAVAAATTSSSSVAGGDAATEGGSEGSKKAVVSFVTLFQNIAENLKGASKGTLQQIHRAAANADKTIATALHRAATQKANDAKRLEKLEAKVKAQAAEISKLNKERGRRRVKKVITPKLDENGNVIPKQPSGITAPSSLSPEMCKFIGVPNGTLMSRVDINSIIHKYVKDHKLNNPEQGKGREIIPDEKLKVLFSHASNDKPLTLFSMQQWLTKHITPVPKPAVAV